MTLLDLLKKKFLKPSSSEASDEYGDVSLEDTVVFTQLSEEPPAKPTYRRRRSQKDDMEQDERTSLLSRFRLPTSHPLRRYWRRYHVGKVLLLMAALFGLVVGGYLFYLAKTAKVSDLQASLKAVTVIYDRNNEEAGSLSGQKGTYVELDAISDQLEQAVIATEDRTFYDNSGINFQRTFLALLTLGKSGGGSTITQQLAKNAYLTQDQTIKRKAREFFLALELTKKYSKNDILTMYLNHAYFGNGVWGVEDASQKYFGVSAAELSLDEAATLAGMLKGPEIYNPYASLEEATNRRDTVLQSMVEAGYISQEVADQHMAVAMAERLADTYAGKVDNYAYPSYFDAVVNEAIAMYGLSEKDIVNNGYRIYTELDQNYQSGMQQTLDNDELIPVSEIDGSQAQAASVALDPTTGGVRGLVGRVNSSEQPTFRTFNFATQAERSPASSIKPLIVYAPALANGWATDSLLPNSHRDFNGYAPHNFGGYESEDVPMYQALAQSYNIPAVYLTEKMGIDQAIAYGKQFGLEMDKANRELGIALGGSVTTNPLEMAQAYATFANGGVMPKAHLITRIETADGRVIKTYKPTSQRILIKAVADQMTSMMLGTFSNGTGVRANVYGYTLAGKTGTSETAFNPELVGDQWVIGYTPDVVISQWVGFEQTDENHYLSDANAYMAPQLFSTQASYILPYTAGTSFSEENSYALDGIAPEYTDEASQTESQDIIDGLRQSAQEAADKLRQAVDDSGLREKAQNLWNQLINYFR
ncbi:penicillin-binding protein PBP2A [Streptococcus sp. E24BD]|uniref:penicillin-binding protein PBP2A n=1 Tax=Streptococcus sp. E24BD TaxID=3278715 RepID=UPI00359F04E0